MTARWSAPATGGACSGSNRGLPDQARSGASGAIGAARWTGVPLSTVLRHAGLRDNAVQVMAVGLDDPYVHEGENHGRVRRPLPIAKALDDVLIAWAMNGEPLPRDHGFPARLIVPGWVGIASIKWLGELRVGTRVEDSPWNTQWYRMHGTDWAGDDAALDRMPVKSTLDAAPDLVEGRTTVLRGRAWSGEATIAYVEVSADAGQTWHEAVLTGPNEPSCWVGWELAWTPPHAGDYELLVRATDSLGRCQPEEAPDNVDGYFFAAVVRTPVVVSAGVSHTSEIAGSAGPGRVNASSVSAIAVALIGIWTCSARSVAQTSCRVRLVVCGPGSR